MSGALRSMKRRPRAVRADISRRRAGLALGCAVVALAIASHSAARAEDGVEAAEVSMMSVPPASRADFYRGLLASLLVDPNPAPADADRLRRGMVGFAVAACATPADEAPAELREGDRAMVRNVVESLAATDPQASTVATHVEAVLATAQCLQVFGQEDAARRQLRAAIGLAHAIDASETAGPVRARIADAAGLSGALPPEEVIALAHGIGATRLEAVVVRAWAVDTLIHRDRAGVDLAAGIYHPTGIDNESLARMSERALEEGDAMLGFLLAAAIEVSLPDLRRPLLERAFDVFLQARDSPAARLVARAVGDESDRGDLLEQLAERALAEGHPAEAEYAARLMPPTRNTMNIWLDIANAYRDAEYAEALAAAVEAAVDIGWLLADEDDGSALMLATGRAAQLDQTTLAAEILTSVTEATDRDRSVADLAKRLAELDQVEEALAWAAQIDRADVDAETRTRAFGPIAKALAEAGRPDEALALLTARADLTGRYLDLALRTIAVEFARSDRLDEASRIAERIEDEEERARAEAAIANAQSGAMLDAVIDRRFAAALAIPDSVARSAALREVAQLVAEFGDLAMLRRLHRRLLASLPASSADPWADILAASLADAGAMQEAQVQLGAIVDSGQRDAARGEVAAAMAEQAHLRDALRLARSIDDPMIRLTTFRRIAAIQAHRLDDHRLLPEIYATRPDEPDEPAPAPRATDGGPPSNEAVHQRAGLAVYELAGAPDLSQWPDVSGLRDRVGVLATPSQVRVHVVAATPGAAAMRLHAASTQYNEKFIEVVPLLDYARRQGEPMPHVIYLDRGTFTLSALRESLLTQGLAHYLEVRGGVYLLRRPLIVGPNATLVISGADAEELRLSTPEYVYLVNGGKLVVADVRITSWDSATQGPSELEPGLDDMEFRPFITAWSGSETFATRSQFRALGYDNRKSWGFTVSAGPQDFMADGRTAMPSPQATLVENLFDRLYYGFYSYHADGANLIGNEYRNNVIYGPDPHDYSDSILMALNTAYGTIKKHGLIVSRGVTGLFVGNIAFDNNGAGIMLDRESNHSIIYANTTIANRNDGISVYETACAIVANNLSSHNAISGLRIRNSIDVGVFDNVLQNNTEEGLIAYTDQLLDHTWRNLELDPFWTIVTVALVNNRIAGNTGALRLDNVFAATLINNDLLDNGAQPVVGSFRPVLEFVIRSYASDSSALLLTNLCERPEERLRTCEFRRRGIFDFDGQQDWQFADLPADCSAPYWVSDLGLSRGPAR